MTTTEATAVVNESAIMLIARVAHEANRGYCEGIGDFSQKPFNEAEQWQKDSVVKGIRGIYEGRITRPSQSHASWVAEKMSDGWTWGETKDPEKKRHPCMVPFEQLPLSQKTKDHIHFAVVKAMIESVT